MTVLVAVSNPGGGIGRHISLTRSVVDIDVRELPETTSLLQKIRIVRRELHGRADQLIVTHGVGAALAARHRGRSLRNYRHVEIWHSDPFLLVPGRRPAFRVIARAGRAPDVQLFVTPWLVPMFRDARTPTIDVVANAVPAWPSAGMPRGGGPDGEERRAVYMGRLSPEKGYSDLLDAWPEDSAQRGWVLDVFGAGPLSERPVPSGVRVRGHTDSFMTELAAADFAVIPSWSEASPYVAIETAAVGTAMVATRTGDIPQLLESGCGWSAQPRDVASLRSAIRTAQDCSVEELARVGALGRSWLAEHRPFDRWAAYVSALYEP